MHDYNTLLHIAASYDNNVDHLEFFAYNLSVDSIANSASKRASVSIENDADFLWYGCSAFATISDAAQTDSGRVIPLIKAQLKDTGSGQDLFENDTPISNIVAGDGSIAYLPCPRILSGSSTLSASFENFSASTTYSNFYFTLLGAKIRTYPRTHKARR